VRHQHAPQRPQQARIVIDYENRHGDSVRHVYETSLNEHRVAAERKLRPTHHLRRSYIGAAR
jgi:hypothetical protein